MTLLRSDTEPKDQPPDDSRIVDMVRIPGGTFRMAPTIIIPKKRRSTG
jgi:hypothetical protein